MPSTHTPSITGTASTGGYAEGDWVTFTADNGWQIKVEIRRKNVRSNVVQYQLRLPRTITRLSARESESI
jgi:hypothetical protein